MYRSTLLAFLICIGQEDCYLPPEIRDLIVKSFIDRTERFALMPILDVCRTDTPLEIRPYMGYTRFHFEQMTVTACVKYNAMKCMEYIHTQKRLPESIYNIVAKYGTIEQLQWLYDRGYPQIEFCYNECMLHERPSMDVLQWLLDHNFPKSKDAYYWAARCGYLPHLVWLVDNGFEKDIKAYSIAIQSGSTILLYWLIANGFPKSEKAYISAIVYDNVEALEILIANDFPKPESAIPTALEHRRYLCLFLLIKHKFPGWDTVPPDSSHFPYKQIEIHHHRYSQIPNRPMCNIL